MPDMQKVLQTKEKILSVIQNSGPSFPARISRETSVSPMFVGAFLSELVAEKRLKLSSMRVGSSPIYLIPGQEEQLQNFSQYLNSKEREAYEILKSSQILQDENQDPAIRVALRKIKDFAVPLVAHDNGQEKILWKFYTLDDDEVNNILQPKKEPVKQVKAIEKEEIIEKSEEKPLKIIKEKVKKISKKDADFASQVKEYVTAKEIEVLQDVALKNKEYHAKVRIDTLFGKQEFLLVAKDKKKVTEEDLSLALHKAQTERMPVFLLAKGDIDKNAKPFLEQWRNLLKFEKLKT